jgi:hypothetical protein
MPVSHFVSAFNSVPNLQECLHIHVSDDVSVDFCVYVHVLKVVRRYKHGKIDIRT